MDSRNNYICKNCSDICDFVKNFNNELSEEYIKSLATVYYKRKETVIKQNSHSSHIIYIKSGLIKVFTERRNDKNIILRIVSPHNFIGLTQMYSDIHNFSAIALKESEVCLIPKIHVLNLMQNSIDFAKIIYKEQSLYTSLLINKISSLGTKQMHGRLADVILYLCNSEFKEEDIFEVITRKDIAEMSGMSSESAIRLLTEFKNDGLIKMNGKKIETHNLELLLRLSDIG